MMSTPPPYPVDPNEMAAPPYQADPQEMPNPTPSVGSRSERGSRSGPNVRV